MHLGLIGYGSIGHELLGLLAGLEIPRISLLVREGRENVARARLLDAHPALADRVTVGSDLAAFLQEGPDVVVEVAGHEAVQCHAVTVLASGTDLVLVSIGALADPALHAALQAAAASSGARLILPAGAVGGIDILAALAPAGDLRVRYTGVKPPRAWAGTPVAATQDLSKLDQPLNFFHGTAREAAAAYPKNANVAATLALAGAGFDATEVTLVADPAATGNSHHFEVVSPLATVSVQISNRASGGNAKTSLATVYSVLREVKNRLGPVAI
jgi:aspartate dehydrogenase